MVLVLGAIVFMSGQAAGVAGVKELCKEQVQTTTGWAIPPATVRHDQHLRLCMVDYGKYLQQCFYSNEEQTHCTVLLDNPSQKKWGILAVDCKTGEIISEQKL